MVDKAFNLLFAFDEAITSGGYKEHVTLANIKTYLVGGRGTGCQVPHPHVACGSCGQGRQGPRAAFDPPGCVPCCRFAGDGEP